MSLILRDLVTKREIFLNKETPLVIGRGDGTGCTDKRVSRKHGQLTCTPENKVHILALHTNPCFIMKKGLPPTLQLKKNEEKILSEGDYFGLLPDAFWFEIIFKQDPLENSVENPNHSIISPKRNSPQPRTRDDSVLDMKHDAAGRGNESTPSKGSSNYNEPSTSNSDKLPRIEPPHSEDVSDSLNASNNQPGSASRNTSLDIEKTKRLPLWMYQIDEPENEVQAKAKSKAPAKRSHSLSAEQVQGKKAKVSNISFSGDDEKCSEPVNDEREPGEVIVKEENVDEPPDVVEVKSEFGNNEEEPVETIKINETEPAPTSEESKNSGEPSKKKDEKDGYESDVVVEPDESNEASNNAPRRRPICQYEASCYRKNPVHKQEYCHPGDADYLRLQDRPQCPYGAACYRQNQLHRVEYQHPTSTPAPRPQPQSSSPASPSPPPKRKPKTSKTKTRSNSDEEDDDYDLEDPFINDASSDDYAPSGSSSEEDEDEFTDLSQTSQENLKRLKKESKKFAKGKKNK